MKHTLADWAAYDRDMKEADVVEIVAAIRERRDEQLASLQREVKQLRAILDGTDPWWGIAE